MNTQEKINFICSNKTACFEMDEKETGINFFDGSATYIGARNYKGTNNDGKVFGKNIEATIIFIDGGIWQYRFLNTLPSDKTYIDAYEFVDIIYDRLTKHLN